MRSSGMFRQYYGVSGGGNDGTVLLAIALAAMAIIGVSVCLALAGR